MRAAPRFFAALTTAVIASALAQPAAAAVIVAEDFNRTDGTDMNGATPDAANLPGGVFGSSQPAWVTQTLGNKLQFGADVALNAPLGAYFTGLLHVSADIALGNLSGLVTAPNRGVGVGFNSAAVAQWNSFTGLRFAPDGHLQFMHNGINEATVSLSGIGANVFYGLSYDVDVDTGVLSNIAISGVSADYSSIVAASGTQNYFKGANNVSVFAGGTRGGQFGYLDNLSLSNDVAVAANDPAESVPEPMPLGILALGLGIVWMARRRRPA